MEEMLASSTTLDGIHERNSRPSTPLALRYQKAYPDDGETNAPRPKSESLDGGWGWVVLFGSFYTTTFLINVTICFGILFSQKMNTLQASSTDVSLVFSMHSVMRNFGTLLTSSLVNKFGHRRVSFYSCFVASISFMLLAFSSSVAYVFIMYGIILATSGGMASTVCFLLVPQYFDRRRGLAMAVIMTGIAVGGIISPLLIRTLQNEYGFFGGCLIHGAIISNCCVAAALYRPPPNVGQIAKSSLLAKKEVVQNSSTEKASTDTTVRALTKIARQMCKWITKKITVSKHLRVILTGSSVANVMVGYFNFLMVMPFFLESAGHTPMFAAWCVATFSIANTCARLLMAVLADRTWFNRRVVFIFGGFLASLSTFAFVFVSFSKNLMTVVMMSTGAGVGLYMSLFHINMIDVLGMELYPEAVGVNSVIMGITFAIFGPLFGLIRDLSGSYSWSIYASAFMQLSASLLVLPLPLAVKRDKKMLLRRQENASKE